MEAGPKTAAERKHAQRTRERGLDPEALSKAKQLKVAQREEQRKKMKRSARSRMPTEKRRRIS